MQILFFVVVLLAIASGTFGLQQVRTLPRRSLATALVVLFVLIAVLLIAFAYWGQYTVAGLRAFDEMDGLYPFAAGLLGSLLAAAAALTGWLARRRRRATE